MIANAGLKAASTAASTTSSRSIPELVDRRSQLLRRRVALGPLAQVVEQPLRAVGAEQLVEPLGGLVERAPVAVLELLEPVEQLAAAAQLAVEALEAAEQVAVAGGDPVALACERPGERVARVVGLQVG